MVSGRQVRKLMKDLGMGFPLAAAALRAGMSENTARKYRREGLPGPRPLRGYRTRPDPFDAYWPEVRALLKAVPGLEAQTIFELLRSRPEVTFPDGQLRSFQRGVRRLRAQVGPEREVMFPQEHRPGEYGQSDFTDMAELGVTIADEPFPHLWYHFVLPYSNWETGRVVFSETFEALVEGFQGAVWELGGVPKFHRTDNLSAATHDLGEGKRAFNEKYLGVLGHYGVLPDANTPGRGHENGDVEQSHHRFKRAVEQALLLRGSRDFADRATYEAFLDKITIGRNRHREAKLREEVAQMRPLPHFRLDDFRKERVPVRPTSTIRVASNVYSVPSRLMGEEVDVRLWADRLEVFYAGDRVLETHRLVGKGGARIDYRHVAASLLRKPGGFARYRWRDALFPSSTFRRAFDALEERLGGRADLEYVRILHLAATTLECEVEAALSELLAEGSLSDAAQVTARVRPERSEPPSSELEPPDLAIYDGCILREMEVAA